MEPEGSLLGSQELTTGPNPEKDESSLRPQLVFLWSVLLILSFDLYLSFRNDLFSSGFSAKICVFLISSTRATYHAHLNLLDLSSQYVARGTN
jgi:hypothetical protein